MITFYNILSDDDNVCVARVRKYECVGVYTVLNKMLNSNQVLTKCSDWSDLFK